MATNLFEDFDPVLQQWKQNPVWTQRADYNKQSGIHGTLRLKHHKSDIQKLLQWNTKASEFKICQNILFLISKNQ
jgi:hypothetical protein